MDKSPEQQTPERSNFWKEISSVSAALAHHVATSPNTIRALPMANVSTGGYTRTTPQFPRRPLK